MNDNSWRWEWPAAVYPFVFAASAPLVSIEVLDSIGAIGLMSVQTGMQRAFLISAVDVALVPIFATIAFMLSRRGIQGAYLAGLSIVISHTWWLNFRATYVRLGTFDNYQGSYWPWFKFAVGGIVLGVILGLANQRQNEEQSSFTRGYWLWPMGLASASALSFFVNRSYELGSAFAPTRWIALLAMSAFTSVVLAAGQLTWRSYEKSVYPG